MDWSTAYLSCFVLGVCFVGFTVVAGHFGGDGHGGHDGGHDGAGHDGHDMSDGVEGVHLPLFSPSVLAIFVGMFGAGGLAMIKGLGITSPVVHASAAAAISLTSGVSVAWAMMKLMKVAESNSIGSHAALPGKTVEVTLSIKGTGFGEIGYEAGGSRHTMIARSVDGQSFRQGDPVQVVRVVEGTAYVGPVGSVAPLQPITSVSTGTPVEKVSQRSK